jgi:hypothetical protein
MKKLKPGQIRVQAPATCLGTLGRAELENVAACIVLYHWDHKLEDWSPVSRKQIADWFPTSSWMTGCADNPFWRPDVRGFVEGGWIEGWDRGGPEDADDLGMVTERFIEAVSNPKIGKMITVGPNVCIR